MAALEGGPEAEAEEAEEEGQLEASDLGREVVDAGEEGTGELADVAERVGGDGLDVLVDEVFVALVGVGEVGAIGLGLEEGFFGDATVGEVGAASEDFGGVEGEREAVVDDFLSGDPGADGEGGAEGVAEADEEGAPAGDAAGEGEGDDDEEVEGEGEEGDAGGEGGDAVDEAGEEGPARGKDPGGEPGREQGKDGEHVAAVFGDESVDVVEVGGGSDGADGEDEAQPAGVEEATDAVDAGDGEGEADGVEALGESEFDAEEGEEGGEEGGVEGALILEAAFEALAFGETDGHGVPSGGVAFGDAFDHEGVVGEVAVGVEAGEDGDEGEAEDEGLATPAGGGAITAEEAVGGEVEGLGMSSAESVVEEELTEEEGAKEPADAGFELGGGGNGVADGGVGEIGGLYGDEVDAAVDPMEPAWAEFFEVAIGDGLVDPAVVILEELSAARHEGGAVVLGELPAAVGGEGLNAIWIEFVAGGEADAVKLLAKSEDAEKYGDAEADGDAVGQKSMPTLGSWICFLGIQYVQFP